MSDFENFDDLDAVRDFRAGVGLMTAEVDDRIRRRIIDLAIARGLADGTRGHDDMLDMDRAGFAGATDLPADRGQPPTPSTSAGSRSSDGSAAVVELHGTARPPARQPRMLVAAAAIVVVILVAGAVLAGRLGHEHDRVDIANPPGTGSTSTDVTVTPSTTPVGALKVVLARSKQQQLEPGQFVRTQDTITIGNTGDLATGSDQVGTLHYTLLQERDANGFRRYAPAEATFTPNGGGAALPVPISALPRPPTPFATFTYDEVIALGTKTPEQIRQQMLGAEFESVENYKVIRDELQLLRLPSTPQTARDQLVEALTTGGLVAGPTNPPVDNVFTIVLRSRTTGEVVTARFDATTGGVLGWMIVDRAGALIYQLDADVPPEIVG